MIWTYLYNGTTDGRWHLTFWNVSFEGNISTESYFIIYMHYIESSPKVTSVCKIFRVHRLTINQHIQVISSKADQVNAFIYRNLYDCPSTVKCNCNKSIVRPVLEYISTVWDPHALININKIKAVKRRAARFCLNDFSTFSSVTISLKITLPLVIHN